jgi:hypothetical protein
MFDGKEITYFDSADNAIRDGGGSRVRSTMLRLFCQRPGMRLPMGAMLSAACRRSCQTGR